MSVHIISLAQFNYIFTTKHTQEHIERSQARQEFSCKTGFNPVKNGSLQKHEARVKMNSGCALHAVKLSLCIGGEGTLKI